MRILITGSRDWNDERIICAILNRYRDKSPKTNNAGGHILVSGACPTGADRIAEKYAEDVGWLVERHPADWDTYGKRAGYIRNSEMAKLGADVCLAFILDNSRGASMMVDLSRKADIDTYVWHETSTQPITRVI